MFTDCKSPTFACSAQQLWIADALVYISVPFTMGCSRIVEGVALKGNNSVCYCTYRDRNIKYSYQVPVNIYSDKYYRPKKLLQSNHYFLVFSGTNGNGHILEKQNLELSFHMHFLIRQWYLHANTIIIFLKTAFEFWCPMFIFALEHLATLHIQNFLLFIFFFLSVSQTQ